MGIWRTTFHAFDNNNNHVFLLIHTEILLNLYEFAWIRISVCDVQYFFKNSFTTSVILSFWCITCIEFRSCSEQKPLILFKPALSAHLGLMGDKEQGSSTERQYCSSSSLVCPEQCRWEDTLNCQTDEKISWPCQVPNCYCNSSWINQSSRKKINNNNSMEKAWHKCDISNLNARFSCN